MKNSFTLIEILIVVAIIAVLAGFLGINYSASQKKARDTKRIADMNTIVSALNAYKREKGDFPPEVTGNSLISWETSIDTTNSLGFLGSLKPYLANVPLDPKNDVSYYYAYRYYENGSASCMDENRDSPFVILAVKKMEIDDNKFIERASCDRYNWSSRFDYSIKIMK